MAGTKALVAVVTAFMIFTAVAFILYIFGQADTIAINQANGYALGWSSTPEYAVMSNIISLSAGICAIVVLVYVIRHSKESPMGD